MPTLPRLSIEDIKRSQAKNTPKEVAQDKKTKTQWSKGNQRDPFYDTSAWRKKSISHRTEFPYCEHCKENGITKLGNVCDHKVLKEEWPGGPLDDVNLQTLCHTCHNRKRSKEGFNKGKI